MSTHRRMVTFLGQALLVMLAMLASCDRSPSFGPTAADQPSQFAASKERAARNSAGQQPQRATAGELAVPGAGFRQGRVRGITAGHLGLDMVYSGVVDDAGLLIHDRLESTMNMDLLQQAIDTYASFELPSAPAEQLAFQCNGYNANALAILSMLAIDNGSLDTQTVPIERVKMGDSAASDNSKATTLRDRFDAQPVLIANEMFSMRELRERILAQGDPRVLAYLIDAEDPHVRIPSSSLWPGRLNEQLETMSERWVNGGALATVVDGELRLSPMLERHAGAFEGETYGGVLGFLEHYADPEGPLSAALRDMEATN